jgi:hypothetical protein
MKHSFVLLVAIACSMWTSTQAQHTQVSCTHVKGERLFKGDSVTLERDGSKVSVRSILKPKDDFWTYKIVFEASELGWFRSIRVGEVGGQAERMLNVLFAGELVYLVEQGEARIEVSSLNASNGQSKFSTMACK